MVERFCNPGVGTWGIPCESGLVPIGATPGLVIGVVDVRPKPLGGEPPGDDAEVRLDWAIQ